MNLEVKVTVDYEHILLAALTVSKSGKRLSKSQIIKVLKERISKLGANKGEDFKVNLHEYAKGQDVEKIKAFISFSWPQLKA